MSREPGLSGHAPSWVARRLPFMSPAGLLLLAMVSFQTGAALAISLFAALGPARASFLRLAFSAAIMLALTIPSRAWARQALGNRRILVWVLASGAAMAVMNLSLYAAFARLPLGIGVAIEFLGPLCLAAAASRRLGHLLWIGLAFAGVLLLSPLVQGVGSAGVGLTARPNLDPVGLVLALTAAAGWAGLIICSGRLGRILPGHGGLALGSGVAALLAVPAILALPSAAGTGFAPLPVLGMAVVAIFSSAIPFALEFEALRRMPPRTYGVLVSLEPVIALLAGILLLQQSLDWRGMLAVAAVTAAAVGMSLTKED
ncbi:MAG TPA: EamA family transporter [Stellaceae bacterium]|nr:EamA family transporter [Stellaceae bacterium]